MTKHFSLKERAHALVAATTELIRLEPDFDVAIYLAVWTSRYLCLNFCGIYRLDDLENALMEKIPSQQLPIPLTAKRNELHVASAVFHNGGHSPLMKYLIAEAEDPPDVLITWPATQQTVSELLGVSPSRVEVSISDQPVIQKIFHWAIKFSSYENVVLHIHPEDVVAALATRIAKLIKPSLTIALMNHADHTFSVAIGAVDKIFEISAYGWALRAQRGSETRSTFVGIPIARPQERSVDGGQGKYAFTGGNTFKYRPFRGHSLPAVLWELLKRDPNIHLKIIGPRSKDYWWWALLFRGGRRVKLMKSLPREEYLRLLNDCAFYIDSYPWPGGTAFPEALMRGGVVAALQGGASGYSYADVLRSNSADEFLNVCVKLSTKDKEALRNQAIVRQRCIDFHAPLTVRKRMVRGLAPSWMEQPPRELLVHRQMASFELDWSDNGRSIIPSLKSLNLSPVVRKAILLVHGRYFGWHKHSTWKLAFDLYLKKIR